MSKIFAIFQVGDNIGFWLGNGYLLMRRGAKYLIIQYEAFVSHDKCLLQEHFAIYALFPYQSTVLYR